ncbi:uromodulin isoform X2 [Pocillopora verrucosa]
METEDVDECSADVQICGSNANCTNTNGSYYCSCHSGFTRSGKECVDIDECTAGVHSCLLGTATCINTIGSYNCSCNLGYVGDGRTSCYVQSAECQNPASLAEANRKVTFTGVGLCDNTLGPNWFRFQGAAGNRMAATCVPTNRCGTHATGWLKGVHPTVSEAIVTRQVCFHWSGECCNWSINIQVRNCNGYFVYNISGTPPVHPCHLRYCGAD